MLERLRTRGGGLLQAINVWRAVDFVWAKIAVACGLVGGAVMFLGGILAQWPLEVQVAATGVVALLSGVIGGGLLHRAGSVLLGQHPSSDARRLVSASKVPGYLIHRPVRGGEATEVALEAVQVEFVNDRPNEVRIYAVTLEVAPASASRARPWWSVPLHRLMPTNTVDLMDLPLVLPPRATPAEARFDFWFKGTVEVRPNRLPREVQLRIRFALAGGEGREIVHPL